MNKSANFRFYSRPIFARTANVSFPSLSVMGKARPILKSDMSAVKELCEYWLLSPFAMVLPCSNLPVTIPLRSAYNCQSCCQLRRWDVVNRVPAPTDLLLILSATVFQMFVLSPWRTISGKVHEDGYISWDWLVLWCSLRFFVLEALVSLSFTSGVSNNDSNQ